MQRHVDEVLAHPAVRTRWSAVGALTVRARRGATAAHYENSDGAAAIAVPDRRGTWARVVYAKEGVR